VVTPVQYVQAPTGQPLPYGLLSVAVDIPPGTDTRWQLGIEYEPDFCGPAFVTEGACQVNDLGTFTVAVGTTRGATLDVNGQPADTYHIDWGDGTEVDDATPDAATHTYGSDGSKTITMTGADGYHATATVVVTNGQASSAVGTVEHEKVPSDGISVVTGVPFTVYHWLECNAVGSADRIIERARRGLELGEGRAIESVLAHQLATDTDSVDLTPTPGTAVHPVDGLGILLSWAGQNYGQLPTIHAAHDLATVLGATGAVSRQGRRLETLIGAPVAAGAGYAGMQGPDETDAGAGEAWLYVTGTVALRRAPVIEVQPQLPTGPATNVINALAERPVVVSAECIIGAVLVTSPYTVPAGA
jgi:hypothetical protein